MRVTILGCGTATGVPMIGCDCPVCTSADPRNRRSRSSIVVERDDRVLLVDTSPDLWAQAIAIGMTRLDAVLFTHAHADHLHGIDELRSFNFVQHGKTIPCYARAEVLERIHEGFGYLFQPAPHSRYARPNITLNEITEHPFDLLGQRVVPLPVEHGPFAVLGFRFDDFAYVTDVSSIPKSTHDLMHGLRLLVLGALRHEPHTKHFSIDQALRVIAEIEPQHAVLTHTSHKIDYAYNEHLPEGVELAYDGMVFDLD